MSQRTVSITRRIVEYHLTKSRIAGPFVGKWNTWCSIVESASSLSTATDQYGHWSSERYGKAGPRKQTCSLERSCGWISLLHKLFGMRQHGTCRHYSGCVDLKISETRLGSNVARRIDEFWIQRKTVTESTQKIVREMAIRNFRNKATCNVQTVNEPCYSGFEIVMLRSGATRALEAIKLT